MEQRVIWQPDAMPDEPPVHGKQTEFLTATEDLVGADGGKGPITLDILIPTPDGWTTMGEIKVGDRVFGDNGYICNVINVSPIFVGHKCYKITFSDKTTIKVDENHLWDTQTSKERKKELSATTKTTRQIKETLRTSKITNHSILVASQLVLPEKELPLDPWLTGYWISNGIASKATIVCGSSVGREKTDLEEIMAHITRAGFECHTQGVSGGGATLLYIKGLIKKLNEMNLIKNKHIPKEYLRASAPQRLALLQGLLDGDGTVHHDMEAEFTTQFVELRNAVYELACSLGMKCYKTERQGKLYGVAKKMSYKVTIIPTIQVFSLKRKAEALRTVTGQDGRRKRRYIVSIEEIPSEPVRCITIDGPSHLYLVTEAMIPTHNSGKSDLLIFDCLYPDKVNDPRWLGVIFRREYKRLAELMDRAKYWTGKIPQLGAHWQGEHNRFVFPRGGRLAFHNVENPGDEEKYQGWEICDLKFDQLEEFTESIFDYLMLQNRTGSMVKPTVKWTANPIGEGRFFVKKRFVDNKHPGQTYEIKQEHRGTIHTLTYRRVFMTVFDNPLLKNDARYIATLANTRSPELRKAFLEGDWNVSVGQFFYDYMESVHCIPARVLPSEWNRLGGLDYGNNKVLSILAADDLGNIYDEWEFSSLPYLENGRMRSKTAGEFAEDSAEWMLKNNIGTGLTVIGDVDLFSMKAKDIGSSKTPHQIIQSIWNKRFKAKGKKPPMMFRVVKKGNENHHYRVACNEAMKEYLRFKMDDQFNIVEQPKFFLFDRCVGLKETLPELVGSPDDMMDFVQYKGEAKRDHFYDSVKMAQMQIIQSKAKLETPDNDDDRPWYEQLYGGLTAKPLRNPMRPQRIR